MYGINILVFSAFNSILDIGSSVVFLNHQLSLYPINIIAIIIAIIPIIYLKYFISVSESAYFCGSIVSYSEFT